MPRGEPMKRFPDSDLAAAIDHAVLKPEAVEADVRAAAALCRRFGCASLCVRPCDVPLAAELLTGSPVAVSTVLSFPHGADAPEIKIAQARRAVADGATEIDMVFNIGRFLSGEFSAARVDVRGVVETAREAGAIVKVILETALIGIDRVAEACEIARDAGADFVKTSTGFSPAGGATPEAVAKMVEIVGDVMGVKASGGIRTRALAETYLRLGASRLGTASTATLLEGKMSDKNG